MFTLLKSLAVLFKESRASIFKTVIANFKCFPYEQAKHLPLFLYGKITFVNEGHIRLTPTFFSPGLIKLGKTDSIIWGSGGGQLYPICKQRGVDCQRCFPFSQRLFGKYIRRCCIENGSWCRLGTFKQADVCRECRDW